MDDLTEKLEHKALENKIQFSEQSKAKKGPN